MDIRRSGSGAVNSASVEHNGVVYLSGFTAEDTSVGVAGQTQQILQKIDSVLAAAGTDKSRLLSATIYLTDMSLKDEMNAVWRSWIPPQSLPARAAVGVDLATPKILVEIMVTAAK